YLNPVWSGEQSLRPIYRQKINGEAEQIGKGCERAEPLSAVVDGKRIDWIERRLVIRSLQQAKMAEAGLQARMTKAQLEALRVLTLLEFTVRRRLAGENEKLSGL
ncbi:hypothetical protein M1O24_00295, partial [Dehalococcoidia bacterium]|nr:hypothetical protein [Dehalococcoidia bacterium]